MRALITILLLSSLAFAGKGKEASKTYVNTTVGLTIEYPNTWDEAAIDNMEDILNDAQEELGLSETFAKEAKQVAPQIVLTLIKQQIINGVEHNSNLNVLVIEMMKSEWDEIDVDAIADEQIATILTEIPSADILKDIFPLKKQPEVKSYVSNLTLGQHEFTQYHYLYLHYPYFIQIAFTVALEVDEKEVKKMIKSLEIDVKDP